MAWRALVVVSVAGCGRLNFDPIDGVGLREVVSFSAHGTHSCAIDNVGDLWCWGSGEYGELGGEMITMKPLPRRVPDVPPIARVDLGENVTFAIDRSNRLWAWGHNDLGQLGIGTRSPAEPQPHLIDVAQPQQTAASQYFTCTRTRTGTTSCWGVNDCGELGDGTTTSRELPGPSVMSLAGTRALAVHDIFACAIDDAEQLRCWGSPLDYSYIPSWSTATLVTGLPRIVQLEGGCHLTMCAVDEAGAVWCIGQNTFGQLGNGTTTGSAVFTQVLDVGPTRGAMEIAVGAYHACARTADDHVYCWGNNASGELGTGEPGLMMTATPRELPFFDGSIPIDDLEAGCNHTCVRSGADLYCWGSNAVGSIGDGALENRYAPVRVRMELP